MMDSLMFHDVPASSEKMTHQGTRGPDSVLESHPSSIYIRPVAPVQPSFDLLVVQSQAR